MGKQQHGPCQRSFNASLTVDVHGSRSPPHAHGEFGSALKMLAIGAYGLGDDAADELAVLSQRIMPDEEFDIVYPGSGRAP